MYSESCQICNGNYNKEFVMCLLCLHACNCSYTLNRKTTQGYIKLFCYKFCFKAKSVKDYTYFLFTSTLHSFGLRLRLVTCRTRVRWLMGTGSILKPRADGAPQACGILVQLSRSGIEEKFCSLKYCKVLMRPIMCEQ